MAKTKKFADVIDAADYTRQSLPKFIADDLARSGLNGQFARFVKPVYTEDELVEILGFCAYNGQKILDVAQAYAIRYPDGFQRIRAFPTSPNPDFPKYFSPSHEKATPWHVFYTCANEAFMKKRQSTKCNVILTEGEKKAAKLSEELDGNGLVIGIPGVSMWKNQNWDDWKFGGRTFFICFDKDNPPNPEVEAQALRLWLFLRKRKAHVAFIFWETDEKGIDDYLVAHPGDLPQLMESANPNPFEVWSTFGKADSYMLFAKILATEYVPKTLYHAIYNEFGLDKKWVAFSVFAKYVAAEVRKQANRETEKPKESTKKPETDTSIIAQIPVLNSDSSVYLVKSTGIWLREKAENGFAESLICSDPILVEARLVDCFGNLAFVRLSWRGHKELVPLTWLSEGPMQTNLAAKGLVLTSANAKKMAHYFWCALDKLKLVQPFATKNGWLGSAFIAGNAAFTQNHKEEIETSQEFNPFEIGQKGNRKLWIDTIQTWFERLGPLSRFMFGASLASFLAYPLGVEASIFHMYGNSSVGKSTTLRICASAFGQSQEGSQSIVKLWRGTTVGHEMYFSTMQHLPCFLDDSQDVRYSTQVPEIVQMFVSGLSNQRGSIKASQVVSASARAWHTLLLSTGEKKLSECSQMQGIAARTIELTYPTPKQNDDDEMAEEPTIPNLEFIKLKQVLMHNFGFGQEAIPLFWQKKAWINAQYMFFLEKLDKLFPQASRLRKRAFGAMALALLGNMMANELWKIPLLTDDEIKTVLLPVMEVGKASIADNFYEFLISLFSRQRGNFATVKANGDYVPSTGEADNGFGNAIAKVEGKNDIGVYFMATDTTPEILAFYPDAIRKIAQEAGFSAQTHFEFLYQQKKMITSPNRFYKWRKDLKRNTEPKRVEFYAIKLPID